MKLLILNYDLFVFSSRIKKSKKCLCKDANLFGSDLEKSELLEYTKKIKSENNI